MFLHRLKNFLLARYYEYQVRVIRRGFIRLEKQDLAKDASVKKLSPAEDFIYKDETWEPIHFLPEVLAAASRHEEPVLRDNPCDLGSKGDIRGDSLVIHSQNLPNNWLCFFYNKPLPENYSFGFAITIYSEFKEIQIAFKYGNLGNRLRFMIRDNREAVFEVIKEGRFYKHIFTRPYSLKIDGEYHFMVVVRGNKFAFFINGEELFAVKETVSLSFLGKGLGLILYDDTVSGEIHCRISDMWLGY